MYEEHQCLIQFRFYFQLEDALLSVQQERDQKLVYKKELEMMKNAEHLQQLNTMLYGLQEDNNDDPQALKQVGINFFFGRLTIILRILL